MTVLERMDWFVHVTRLDRAPMFFDNPRPRAFRWWPLLILTMMIAGYALMASPGTAQFRARSMIIGGALFLPGFIASILMRLFGPRFIPHPERGLDERELGVAARARAISGTILTCTFIGGCFYMGVLPLFGWWQPTSTSDWTMLALLVEGAAFLLPVLLASWLLPRPADEAED